MEKKYNKNCCVWWVKKNDLISQFKLTAKVMLKFHSTKRFANFFQRFFSHPTTTNRRGAAKMATPRFALNSDVLSLFSY